MHIELVELLKCPVAHEPSVLVAATDRVEARYIFQGLLGCPVCSAEYPIVNGITYFDVAAQALDGANHDRVVRLGGVVDAVQNNLSEVTASVDVESSAGVTMALAAGLSLSEGAGTFALFGYPLQTAVALRAMVPVRMLVINPPDDSVNGLTRSGLSLGDAPAGVIVAAELPLVSGKLSGVAVNQHPHDDVIAAGARTLRPRGRLVASIVHAVPAGVTELARDERVWVAERDVVASSPVELVRRFDNPPLTPIRGMGWGQRPIP